MPVGQRTEPRIAFVDGFPRMGGTERNLVDLLARLDRRRFTPFFVTSEEGELTKEVRKLDIPVLFCPLPEEVSVISRMSLGLGYPARLPVHLFSCLCRLAKTVRSVHPRLIYSNSLKDPLCSTFLGPVPGKPVVWHGMDFPGGRRLRGVLEAVARSKGGNTDEGSPQS